VEIDFRGWLFTDTDYQRSEETIFIFIGAGEETPYTSAGLETPFERASEKTPFMNGGEVIFVDAGMPSHPDEESRSVGASIETI